MVPDHQVGAHLRDPAARARLADEIADVLIYLLRLADVCGIDPLAAALAKIERNQTRFPPLPAGRGGRVDDPPVPAGRDGHGNETPVPARQDELGQ